MNTLTNRRLLITRPRAQAAELGERLTALGAQPILFPTIEIAPPENFIALDNALAALADYHWLLFTSVNGVAAFWSRLDPSGLREADPKGLGLKIAAIGPATARALTVHGLAVTALPETFTAHHLPKALGDVRDQRMLFPRGELARETLADELRKRGARVDDVIAYRTLPATPDPHGLTELRRGVDAVTFTSPSAVNNFVRLVSGDSRYIDPARIRRLGPDGIPLPSLGRAVVACLGPTTARAAHDSGLPVDVTANESTLSSLIAALQNHFARPISLIQENRWIRSLARCL